MGKLGRGSCPRLTFFWRQSVYWVCKIKSNFLSIMRRDNVTFPVLTISAPAAFSDHWFCGIFFQESLGRYLDLHELYYQYVNSKFGEPIEYSAYLDVFSDTDKIPRKMKMTRWIVFSVELIWQSFGIYGHPSLYLYRLLTFCCSISSGSTENIWRIFWSICYTFSSGQNPCKILIEFCQRWLILFGHCSKFVACLG